MNQSLHLAAWKLETGGRMDGLPDAAKWVLMMSFTCSIPLQQGRPRLCQADKLKIEMYMTFSQRNCHTDSWQQNEVGPAVDKAACTLQ
jgi:hypothetical protein